MSLDQQELETVVARAMSVLEERMRREREALEEEDRKQKRTTSRVSIAAFTLTMLLSFLGFVRAANDSTSTGLRNAAGKANDDIAGEWSLYQTRTAQRTGYEVARDSLTRESLGLPAGDPRLRLARFSYADYGQSIRRLDRENRQVFFVIQDLTTSAMHDLRDAANHDRQTYWYDMGTRTLTLALVLISVTLLAHRDYLFWLGLFVALAGAAVAINGYFLFVR
jgi:hypothetical protein